MIQLREGVQIYLYNGIIDMRKAIDGLTAIVVQEFEMQPQAGDVFVFHNKNCNKVKALYWDRNGFIVHYKRLEKGRFRIKLEQDGKSIVVQREQLAWLLAGLDFMLMKEFSELNFTDYF